MVASARVGCHVFGVAVSAGEFETSSWVRRLPWRGAALHGHQNVNEASWVSTAEETTPVKKPIAWLKLATDDFDVFHQRRVGGAGGGSDQAPQSY